MKRLWMAIGVLAAGLLLAPFIVPILFPWSGINNEHQDINIKTGQARYSHNLWFIKISQRIEDTALSRALQGETVDVADIKPWQRVNTFSPGLRHSPHYHFHGALSQAKLFEMTELMPDLTPERKKEIAKETLAAWQCAGHDGGADVLRLMEEATTSD